MMKISREFRWRWFWAVSVGLAFAVFAHTALHSWHWSVALAIENWAFDSVMRATAANDSDTPPDARKLALIDVDDTTWRSSLWGGGEPHRAPRKELARLIDFAFAAGAQQVVLDVLVEEREGADVSATQQAERAEDEAFADALRELQTKSHFGMDRYLVLARSLRHRVVLFSDGSQPEHTPHDRLITAELRRSAKIDAAVEESAGRIDVGLPYFRSDSDGVVRGWLLFQIACKARRDAPSQGVTIAHPSVPLLVYAKNSGLGVTRRLGLRTVPGIQGNGDPCAGASSAHDAVPRIVPTIDEASGLESVNAKYWDSVRREFCGERPSARCPLPERVGVAPEIGNRLIYHHAPEGKDLRIPVLRALDLLDGSASGEIARRYLQDRVVVIAQSFAESRDRHDTPLGTMSGGWVLLNAIDSIGRGNFIQPPASWVTAVFVMLECLIVGWFFTLWNSLRLVLVLALIGIAVLVPLCYFAFLYGVWLDFALPIAGIAFHKFVHDLMPHRKHSH